MRAGPLQLTNHLRLARANTRTHGGPHRVAGKGRLTFHPSTVFETLRV